MKYIIEMRNGSFNCPPVDVDTWLSELSFDTDQKTAMSSLIKNGSHRYTEHGQQSVVINAYLIDLPV